MTTVTGATLLARALKLAGVGPIFTLSGNQILPIYEAGLEAGLRFVDTRHESAAAHMADAWGRLTQRPGVCVVTAGPGHTNALTGVATAWMAESPLLFLSGGCDLARVGQGGFQELDQIGIAAPICKDALFASSAAELPALVAHAHRIAQEGIPGPVHITLPFDVLNDQVAEAAASKPAPADFEPTHRRADKQDLQHAIELLARASRLLLLAGPAAWRGVCGDRLRALLDLVEMPGFAIESPRGLSDPSLHGLGKEFRRADLVLLIAPQDFAVGFAGPPALGESSRIIQIAPERGQIGRNREVEVGLVGDPQTVIGQLLEAAQGQTWRRSGWRDELAAIQASNVTELAPRERSDERPLHPLRVAAEVRGFLRPGDCLALDGGEFGQWARWALAGGPYETLGNGKLGGIGGGISFAIAAAIARPEARTVAIVGDGTFGFHGMELDTAVRHQLPFVVVIGNDAGWASERHRQRELYGPDRLVATDLLPTRYDLVAEALGAHGEHVERPDELGPALKRAFASRRPACVNVAIASIPNPAASHA
ncbi:MAG TPA: thiamine pyrophosphate-binding protein [Chloroflexota bacterium]|nr:thiamine pyrophosphate-binding protein [Chloroflexota bacterium]